MIWATLLLLQAQSGPWEGYKKDPIVRQAERLAPAIMIVSNGQTIKTISYKTMAACERARSYVSGPPAGSPAPGGGIYGPPAITYACVPR
jgi:hypothetical protein